MTIRPIKRALISVYDKSGIVELAQALTRGGAEIVSTGSTAATIEAAGISVTPVTAVTNFPECLGGRVKTLHPGIHAGLLADVRNPDHAAQLEELEIKAFDLVVVNLYPFNETVASGATNDECVEQIDIGGPAMIRASAKNYANVAVVVSPNSYSEVLTAIAEGGTTLAQRALLSAQAFSHTATYDIAVATWMSTVASPEESEFPRWRGTAWTRSEVLRYGENPHQSAASYIGIGHESGVANAQQLQGKPMSYNNFIDSDAARRAAFDFSEPAVAIIKHANPCGIAVGLDIEQAYRKAHSTDPVSAFGGVVAANRRVTKKMAESLLEVFTEVIIAPEFDADALNLLKEKANLRILVAPGPLPGRRVDARTISGGLLVQSVDTVHEGGDNPVSWNLVSGEPASTASLRDLEFAWRACRSVKSNAILLAKDLGAVGIGMGQVNRVDSAHLAVSRAGDRARGAVAASDAFFPFADGLQLLLQAGVSAVVQPGGSVRDSEVIDAAQAAGVTMYFTGTRHFFH
ncbi:MAG: bifunctional phosphoribosylaminoimidazolecarboxamide formyltransferase/IMP cyclohydrolase [Candidatus Nanopelagicales bacterium]